MKIIVIRGRVDGLTFLYEQFIKNCGWFRLVEQSEEDNNPDRNPLFPEKQGFPSKLQIKTYQLYLDGQFLNCKQKFVYDFRNNYAETNMTKESKDTLDRALANAGIKPFGMPANEEKPIIKSRSI